MSWSGSGTFLELTPPTFPAVPGEDIVADYFNAVIRDIHDGLANVVTRDGQSPATANLPMGGYKHTGVAAASAIGQYLAWDQSVAFTNGAKVGYRSPPRSLIPAGTYTFVLGDEALMKVKDDGLTVTVPPNASVAFPEGTVLLLLNIHTADMTVSPGAGVTLYLAGTVLTGTRTLPAKSYMTLLQDTADTWYVSGAGVL